MNTCSKLIVAISAWNINLSSKMDEKTWKVLRMLPNAQFLIWADKREPSSPEEGLLCGRRQCQYLSLIVKGTSSISSSASCENFKAVLIRKLQFCLKRIYNGVSGRKCNTCSASNAVNCIELVDQYVISAVQLYAVKQSAGLCSACWVQCDTVQMLHCTAVWSSAWGSQFKTPWTFQRGKFSSLGRNAWALFISQTANLLKNWHSEKYNKLFVNIAEVSVDRVPIDSHLIFTTGENFLAHLFLFDGRIKTV